MFMTMQTKIIFNKWNKFKGWTKTFEVFIENNKLDASHVVFDEYEPIHVRFECDDPKGYLVIQRFDADEELKLNPGEEDVLQESLDELKTDDVLWPGQHLLSVFINGRKYEDCFRVKPKNLSGEALANLKQYLEEFLRGMSNDLYIQKLGMNTDGLEYYPSILELYKQLNKNYSKLKHSLDLIVADPIVNMEKLYKISMESKRPDYKSQKWLVSQKGAIINANPYNPAYVYEKRSSVSKDTIENRWVKKIIHTILQSLKSINDVYDEVHKRHKNNYDALLEQLEVNNVNLERLKYNKNATKEKQRISENIIRIKSSMKKTYSKITAIKENKREINKMLATFSQYQYETWLTQITRNVQTLKPTLKLQKDSRYSTVYHIYRNLNKISKDKKIVSKYTFPPKKTSLLFEQYIYIILINILRDLDYKWTDGWIANYGELTTLGDLPSETIVKLEKDNHYIELAYECVIPKGEIATGYSYFRANINDTPDYRLSLHKDNGEFLAALVLDAKCRRYSNIYNKNHRTDTMAQLEDYLNISYFDHIKHANGLAAHDRVAVKKVIAIYPKQDEGKPVELTYLDGAIALVQLEPSSPDSIPFGYDNIKQLFEKFLENYSLV